jgi:UDP-glucose:glycoprotein glucosyltransferase
MVVRIPYFSRLYCETWCTDEELKVAKTIDLCNNPMTKEPKLERARRILPEWDGLDKEITAFSNRVLGKSNKGTKDVKKEAPSEEPLVNTNAKSEPVAKEESLDEEVRDQDDL